tara:strand:+ start:7363 stop:8100 length:738 start_codon:yes stop_codon:yes gene_type:complete
MGGLGNVLFQVNFGRHLRAKGYDVCFVDNLVKKNIITKILRWKIHSPDYLSLDEEFVSKSLVYAFLTVSFAKLKISNFALWIDGFFDLKKHAVGNVFCYFQNADNLGSIDIRLTRGEFKNSSISDAINENIVVHRRYTDSGWAQPSLVAMEKKIGNTAAVLVCSDSIAAVKRDFGQYSFNYNCREGFSALDDFLAMADCKTLVCSNSTFAFWAALIGDHDYIYMPRALVKKFPCIKILKKEVYEF